MNDNDISWASDEELSHRLKELAGMADDSSPEYAAIRREQQMREAVRSYARKYPSSLTAPETDAERKARFSWFVWAIALTVTVGLMLLLVFREIA